jgi:hypothetical protein
MQKVGAQETDGDRQERRSLLVDFQKKETLKEANRNSFADNSR